MTLRDLTITMLVQLQLAAICSWWTAYERTLINQAVQLDFPPEAAPLSTDFSDAISIKSLNTFVRGDYQAGQRHHLSFRWSRVRD